MKHKSTSTAKTIADLGEFRLIEKIESFLRADLHSEVILSVGDDTAVIRQSGDKYLLATCDILIEGIHFDFDSISPHQLGRRAMAVNLSDIAAMGGRPTFALVSLALPKTMSEEVFSHLYRGLTEMAREHETAIVGGNLASAGVETTIDVFLLGECDPGRLLTRSGANPGDQLYVSGSIGSSAAGLALLKRYGRNYPKEFAGLVESHNQPQPRVALGSALAASELATAMIDISDGLASDLGHICDMSKVGVEISSDEIPVCPEVALAAGDLEGDALDFVLQGGEDYELLFTLKAGTPQNKIQEIAKKCDVRITRIGEILEENQGRFIRRPDGSKSALRTVGWNHYAPGKTETE